MGNKDNIKMSVKVIKNKLPSVELALANLSNVSVVVGVVNSKAGRADGTNNAYLAAIHERGSAANNIPPRPFLKPGIESNKDKIIQEMNSAAKLAIKGDGAGFDRVGLVAQSAVKKYITTSSNFKGLMASTLAARKRKGFAGTKPLIHTGSLLNSISYEVRNG